MSIYLSWQSPKKKKVKKTETPSVMIEFVIVSLICKMYNKTNESIKKKKKEKFTPYDDSTVREGNKNSRAVPV
jgi:hypothetical protein